MAAAGVPSWLRVQLTSQPCPNILHALSVAVVILPSMLERRFFGGGKSTAALGAKAKRMEKSGTLHVLTALTLATALPKPLQAPAVPAIHILI